MQDQSKRSENLYRRYRPHTFSDLIGQEQVTRILRNRILQKDIAQGFLFCGPRGTGKTSVARILACALNCLSLVDGYNPCLSCVNCIQIHENSFIDLVEIDAASHRGIDEIRRLQEGVQYRPSSGLYKIYILDEVHMLTDAASNALLKTLEEPPPKVIFIFCTTEPHKVIPTMLSRLERHDFFRHIHSQIVGRLQYIVEKESALRPLTFPKFETSALNIIAEISDGSLRDALTTLEQLALLQKEGETVTESMVSCFLNRLDSRSCFEILGNLIEGRAGELLTLLSQLYDSGREFFQITEDLISFLSKWIQFKLRSSNQIPSSAGSEDQAIGDSNKEGEYIQRLDKSLSLASLLNLQRNFLDLSLTLKEASHPHSFFELNLLELCSKKFNDQTQTQTQPMAVLTQQQEEVSSSQKPVVPAVVVPTETPELLAPVFLPPVKPSGLPATPPTDNNSTKDEEDKKEVDTAETITPPSIIKRPDPVVTETPATDQASHVAEISPLVNPDDTYGFGNNEMAPVEPTEVNDQVSGGKNLQKHMDTLVRLIKNEHKGPLHALLKEASIIEWSSERIALGYDKKYTFHLSRVKDAKSLDVIKLCCAKILGEPPTILEIDFIENLNFGSLDSKKKTSIDLESQPQFEEPPKVVSDPLPSTTISQPLITQPTIPSLPQTSQVRIPLSSSTITGEQSEFISPSPSLTHAAESEDSLGSPPISRGGSVIKPAKRGKSQVDDPYVNKILAVFEGEIDDILE